ncbi:MAG: adenylate/guanylate cyclase domain-containing protein, partial [Gammaproteobacteria bacterium]|nr:adenylate/guanylate cyclase domain-containing protein [Gammaproteobacteria bacterium]
IDTIADWLIAEALAESDVESIFEGCCNRLQAAGIPLWRALLSYPTLHPLHASIWLTWSRGKGVGVVESLLGYSSTSDEFLRSPFYHMTQTRIPFLRRRLTGVDATLDFLILEEFQERGATDYLAFIVPFGNNAYDGEMIVGIMASWTTDRTSGFSANDIQALQRIEMRLAVACRVIIERQISKNILSTYLGHDAGHRVLKGQIKRGDGESIYAVIWYCDLRNSTGLADEMEPDDFLKLLNTYFECTAGAVLANGGEVLRFVGDAVLAIFPVRDDGNNTCQACEAAVMSAREAQNRHQKCLDETAIFDFGLGLHIGNVMFGNIGVPERLEFSVIGPTANEVARLEGLTKTSGHQVLVTGEFAKHLDIDWIALGAHELRGVGGVTDVFALPPAT